MSFTTLLRLEQKLFASAIASAKSGSSPDGSAPSWREIIYVFLPAGIGPVVVVAQPKNTAVKTITEKHKILVI
jgi:hypothetical protein